VSDTGIGIQESELGNLFKPFYTTKPTGRGFGLAYCERAVEAHEGTIDVESKAGEGAKFTISLPKKTRKTSRKAVRKQLIPQTHHPNFRDTHNI
jgi:signal transduction histidine kinase